MADHLFSVVRTVSPLPTVRPKPEEPPFDADKETTQLGTRLATYFRHIFKKYSNTMNILLWVQSCSMWTDGQTDRQTEVQELVASFRNFAKTPRKLLLI
jgi:hypothetical protein